MDSQATGLEAVYVAERAALLRFLRARCGGEGEAEDVLQDLWLKLDGISTGPIANARAYLFRMANNLVLDRRRGQTRAMQRDRAWLGEEQGRASPKDPEMQPDPAMAADEALTQRQEADLVRQAIAGLPPGARRALELFRLEGRSQAQVAEIMGISRSGVEKHLALAMKHLRNALSDCGYFVAAASEGYRAAPHEAAHEDQGL